MIFCAHLGLTSAREKIVEHVLLLYPRGQRICINSQPNGLGTWVRSFVEYLKYYAIGFSRNESDYQTSNVEKEMLLIYLLH